MGMTLVKKNNEKKLTRSCLFCGKPVKFVSLFEAVQMPLDSFSPKWTSYKKPEFTEAFELSLALK